MVRGYTHADKACRGKLCLRLVDKFSDAHVNSILKKTKLPINFNCIQMELLFQKEWVSALTIW